ncbi:MAG: magnesium protoporphyrin IX methyltransferase [Pseudomonadota bacterium]
MTDAAYNTRRSELETYFDKSAKDNWIAMTSKAPINAIRRTVRAGRDQMRTELLSWLPEDLTGARLLDAGCGTGMFAIEAAKRGADVLAVDLSPGLIDVARERTSEENLSGSIDYRAGDMTDPSFGAFDYIIAMDSFIHYQFDNLVDLISTFAARTRNRLLFTVAPKTALLTLMHASGQLFPRSNRSPAIVPVSQRALIHAANTQARLADFEIGRVRHISSAFYQSKAVELLRG